MEGENLLKHMFVLLRRQVVVAQWFIIALLVGALAASAVLAQTNQTTVRSGETLDVQMEPGARLTVDCPDYANAVDWNYVPFSVDVYCGDEPASEPTEPPSTPTAEPTTEPTEPPATPTTEPTAEPTEEPGGEPSETGAWHAATDHEHGDAPPQWVTDWSMENFGHGVIYGGDEQTPNEWVNKPRAFKGALVRQFNPDSGQYVNNGAEGYLRFHGQSNAMGRSAQYHSYEFYWRDSAGNVSFWQGHADFGDPATRRFVRIEGDPGTRPAMLVVDQATWDAGTRTEQWYGRTSNGWDIGINFGFVSTLYEGNEAATLPDMGPATGGLGLTRLVDGTWYTEFDHPEGWYCSAPNRLVDSGVSAYNEATGECGDSDHVPNYVAPTINDDGVEAYGYNRIDFRVDKRYACSDCVLPN